MPSLISSAQGCRTDRAFMGRLLQKGRRGLSAPAVIEMLLDEESQHLAGLSDFIGKPISLQAERALGPDQYDIVLL